MQRAKLVSILAGTALGVGGIYAAGMYTAHHDWAPYRGLVWTVDSAQTLIEEMPNLRGTEPVHFLEPARYEGKGVTVNDPAAGADDLILLSGFLDDDNRVRLMRRDGTVVNDWRLRASEILPDPAQCRDKPMTDWNAIAHGTIASPDGDIVMSFESCGAARIDRCGNVKWATSEITHHSPNWLADGGVVISGGQYIDKPTKDLPWPYKGPYWEDLLFRFSADGQLVLSKPMTEMFKENGMAALLNSGSQFESRVDGEFHQNEIEELKPEMAAAFPMFEAGDLLMSFRNLNMLVVTNADATKVKWHQVGPWVRQHDGDFQPDGTITVFDNHTDNTLDGSREGGSRVLRVNPATGMVTTVYGGRDGQRFYTSERGTQQMRPGGGVMVTEAQSGRAFEADASGKIVWEYINRWDDDRIAWLHNAEVYPAGFFTVADWSCPAP